MMTVFKYRDNNTFFVAITDSEDGQIAFMDYVMPEDIAQKFNECVTVAFAEVEFPYWYIWSFQEKDSDVISTFLEYVLSFDNIDPMRKFATIYSFMSTTAFKRNAENEDVLDVDKNAYVFDVHNNSVVHDILTRQEISSESEFNHVDCHYYANPVYVNGLCVENDFYTNYFAGSLQDYCNRIGAFNYLTGMANTVQEGVELGFMPSPLVQDINFNNDFAFFCDFVDFDDNGDKPIRLNKVKDAWIVFTNVEFNASRYIFDNSNTPYVNNRFMSWFLTTDLDAAYKKKSSSMIDYCNDYSDQLSKYWNMWLLYAEDNIRENRYDELKELYNFRFKNTDFFGSLCVWLGDNESKTKDVPLTLLLELFDDEINNYEGV